MLSVLSELVLSPPSPALFRERLCFLLFLCLGGGAHSGPPHTPDVAVEETQAGFPYPAVLRRLRLPRSPLP